MQVRRSVSVILVLLASACSGASTTELFDQVDQNSSPTAPIVGREGDDGSGTGSSSSGGTSVISGDGSSSGGSSGSSGGATTDGGGSSPDAAPQPTSTCLAEKEPNDGPELTEWFTECFSGSVKKGDIDYASISAPQTATHISIKHSETGGDVRYRLYINGLQYGSFSGDAPNLIPVFAGGTYSFEISPVGTSAATRNYELHVSFE